MPGGSTGALPWLLFIIVNVGTVFGGCTSMPEPENFCHQEILQWTHYGLFHQMPESGTVANFSVETHFHDFGDQIARPDYEKRWGKHTVGAMTWTPPGFVSPNSDTWYPQLLMTTPARISATYEESMTLEEAEYYFMTFASSVLDADEKTLRSYFNEFMKTDGRHTDGTADPELTGYRHEVTVANDFRTEALLAELHAKGKPAETGRPWGNVMLEWPEWEVALYVPYKEATYGSDDEAARFTTSAWGASEFKRGGLIPLETPEFTERMRSLYRDFGFDNLQQTLMDEHARATDFTDCRSATEPPS